MYPTATSNRTRQGAIVTILASVWLVVSPFVLGYTGNHLALWNAFGVAIVSSFLVGIRLSGAATQGWLSWLNALLGVWLIVSPFVMGNSDNLFIVINDVIVGVILALAGAWSALGMPQRLA